MAGKGCRSTCLAGEWHIWIWGIPGNFRAVCWHRQTETGKLEHTCIFQTARGRKEDAGGIAAAVPGECCMENKVAVMRKLEARVMMVNRLKRKSLKKNVRETKWKDVRRMSNKTCWNPACEWSLYFSHGELEKYNCREWVVGTHYKYEPIIFLWGQGKLLGSMGLLCCWWECGPLHIHHNQGFGNWSCKVLSAPTDRRHHSHGNREKCIAGLGSGHIKVEVRISVGLAVGQLSLALAGGRGLNLHWDHGQNTRA